MSMNELKERRNNTDLNDTNNEKNKIKDEQKNENSPKKSPRKPFTLIQSNESFHTYRESYLSSSSHYTNYRGLLNLCVVLLVMSSGRLVIENVLKYGFLVRFDIPILFIKDPTGWPALLAFVCTNIFISAALFIEKSLQKGEIKEQLGYSLGITNIALALLLPAIYLWYRQTNPVSACFALATYTILSMKLYSYMEVNRAYRLEYKKKAKTEQSSKQEETKNKEQNIKPVKLKLSELLVDSDETKILDLPKVEYPNNLNAKDIYYFMAVPTLCYELNFPRTDRIRKTFLIRRFTEMIFLISLQFVLVQQWMVPILRNSQMPFRESNIPAMIERLLKLAVPNHVIWLIFFYVFFHSYLNVLAEVLRFGDRLFYKDWWNAETVSEFWQNWNIPVHNFCTRHIYKPLLTHGITKFQASLVVFFVSAFFHEYLVSIPLRMFRLWSFLGMILQIPFAVLVQKFLHHNYGNMAVWVSLIIGQPIAIMMYIHDYYVDYFKKAI